MSLERASVAAEWCIPESDRGTRVLTSSAHPKYLDSNEHHSTCGQVQAVQDARLWRFFAPRHAISCAAFSRPPGQGDLLNPRCGEGAGGLLLHLCGTKALRL